MYRYFLTPLVSNRKMHLQFDVVLSFASFTNYLLVPVLHRILDQRWRERPSGTTARASSCFHACWSASHAIFVGDSADVLISTKPAWKFIRVARSWVEQIIIYEKKNIRNTPLAFQSTSQSLVWIFYVLLNLKTWTWKSSLHACVVFIIFQRTHTEWYNVI